MAKDANETVIQIDHQTGVATIWTCNRRILGRLRRIHAKETRKQIGGAWFELPEKGISLRKSRNKAGSQCATAESERTDPESHEPDVSTAD